ncbi:hypothetical protein QQS21_008263 [Conoideocrella luteorostrata]|uniref:Cytochrome P450 n=1 Tax=Conoideocrella luteorostrata TaxID=1105319 RepID=A0AAJ0FW66_9HYPO|nr:hypothetical protein QQS21_008263 [Conoideocrella luteorostrata]
MNLKPSQAPNPDKMDSQGGWWPVFAGSALVLMLLQVLKQKYSTKINAPTAGYRWFFEPSWLLRMRFVTGSSAIIDQGYQKFKNSIFTICRNDGDLLVISNKYLDELRYLPEEKLSATAAHEKNFMAEYTTINHISRSNLHAHVVLHKLTPKLGDILPIMKDELDFALREELPDCEGEWVKVQIYDIILNIVSRVSARVFVGLRACRNEQWLATSRNFTENFFVTVMILRMLPRFLRPMALYLLPSHWRLRDNIKTAKQIIGPIVQERRAAELLRETGIPGNAKDEDLLQLMMDAAGREDASPAALAHRQLFVSLAAIHSSTVTATNVLLDLCAHPEFIPLLRSDLANALVEDGGWKRSTMAKLHSLDSCMKESVRMSPASQLGFNRIVQQHIKLSDGIILPAGTHITMPVMSPMYDPANVGGDPGAFDPFRFVDRGDKPPQVGSKNQFTKTDRNNLNFGYGKHACPGRFFASHELKLILSHLLLDFDFRYLQGTTRPKNRCADETMFPERATCLLIRRKPSQGIA